MSDHGQVTARIPRIFMVLAMAAFIQGNSAAADRVLTTIGEARALTVKESTNRIPLLVTGVVTAAEPYWNGKFFIQDAGVGIWINSTSAPPPMPGDLVQVSGFSHPGRFSRDVAAPQWTKIGTAALPVAKPVSGERFISGVDDGCRVEVAGVVNSETADKGRIILNMAAGEARFQALLPLSTNGDQLLPTGTKVRVRGTVTANYDPKLKRLTSVKIYAPQVTDLVVDEYPTRAILTNAAGILARVTKSSKRIDAVSLTGVVTAAEPNWGGNFFLQDASGGVYVNSSVTAQPAVGDLVQVRGVSHLGAYAPDMIAAQWTKVGTAPLPDALAAPVDRLMSGAEDGRRVEVTGVIRSVRVSELVQSRMMLMLACGGFRFQACCAIPTNVDLAMLPGATVRLRGTMAASFNASLRHILTVVLFAPRESDFDIEELPGNMVWQKPLTTLSGLAQYHDDSASDARIRVKGVVTYQRPGEDIFLHDDSGGLQVECAQTNVFAPGEIVEAVGFPALERFLPVLQDATVVRAQESGVPVAPIKMAVPKLLEGFNHSDLISLQGTVLDCSLRPLVAAQTLSNSPAECVLTVQSGKYVFSVVAPATGEFAGLAAIPIGSTVAVSGICQLQTSEDGKIDAVKLLLLDEASLRVLKQPNWWTPRRLLAGLGGLLVVSLVGMTWTIMILRKNSALQLSIAETVEAQGELQKAHDLLETRVQERTKQLKFEMGARREAEVRFKAVLEERTRLAQELHDTLLQGFTGIGLKLDAFAQSLPAALTAAKEKLQQILGQSDQYLTEARRTIWELRSPSLAENQDFSEALSHVCNRSLEGTEIHLDFSVDGEVRQLERAVEDNLLRISEEAVTNAVKHARPQGIQVALKFSPREVQLRIQDDGCGFRPDGPEGTKAGHFGLVGIRERVKSLNGNLSLNSQANAGTQVVVTVQT